MTQPSQPSQHPSVAVFPAAGLATRERSLAREIIDSGPGKDPAFRKFTPPQPRAVSVGSIQSVARCLTLLHALNGRNGASAQALARAAGLPRGTTYRMLETLAAEGYVRKDHHTGGYWLEAKSRQLGAGYVDQSWILDEADRIVAELQRDTNFCYCVTTPDHIQMYVRITTILRNPAGGHRTTAGTHAPMGQCASGHVVLAHQAAPIRGRLLDEIYGNAGEDHAFQSNGVPIARSVAERLLESIRARGFAVNDRSSRIGVLAVPVMRGPEPVAALSMNFFHSSLKRLDMLKHLPRLQQAAAAIAAYGPRISPA